MIFVFIKGIFVDFFVFKIYTLSNHSYTWQKKNISKNFIIIVVSNLD